MAHPFDIFRPQVAAVIGLLFVLVLFVTMVYRADRGNAGRTVPDQDPLHLRCRCPTTIGNGWFGGLLPATAFAIVASTGDI